MAEVDLLVTVMGYVAHLDEDELLLLRRLQEAQESRRCPTFGRANVAALACLANQIGQQLDGASTTVDHMTDAPVADPDPTNPQDEVEPGADLLDRTLTAQELEDLTEGDEAPVEVAFTTQDYSVDTLVKRLQTEQMMIPHFGSTDERLQTAGFQRGFVWTKAQMDRFVESLLLGYPVPGIFLVRQMPGGRLLVLDGQQRLETLRRFYDGLHEDKVFALQNVSRDLAKKTYKSLDEESRFRLDDSYLQATIVNSDGSSEINDAIYRIFERLNSGGTQLTPHEIRVALYAGPLVAKIQELNTKKSWRALFGAPSKRIRDHELISRVLALFMDAGSYSRPLKKYLNDFYDTHRDAVSLTDGLDGIFERATDLLMQQVGPAAFRSVKGNQVNVAQAEAVLVGLMRAVARGSEPDDLLGRVERLKGDDRFIRRTQRATADNDAVAERLQLATKAFQ